MRIPLRWYGFIVVAIGLLAPAPSRAGIVVFNGSDPGFGPGGPGPNSVLAASQFNANVSSNLGVPEQHITFEGLPLNTPLQSTSLVVYTNPNPVFGNVTLTTTGTDHTPAINNNYGISNVGSVLTGFNTTPGGSQFLKVVPEFGIGTASATFTFTYPIQAFGAYVTGLNTDSGPLHVTFTDSLGPHDLTFVGSGKTFSNPQDPLAGGVQFIGFVDKLAAIHSVTLALTNVTGSSRDSFGVDDIVFVFVPEPSSVILLGTGLLAVVIFGRRALGRRGLGRGRGPTKAMGPTR
jgi:hypothetical protein